MQVGRMWVVDIDLERFFDRVNHDILMSRVARHVEDTRVLKLIRRYLEAGLMRDGGGSDAGPGHAAGRAAVTVAVEHPANGLGSRAGEAWSLSLRRRLQHLCPQRGGGPTRDGEHKTFLGERLRLLVNDAKSACARPWRRTFLGYTLTYFGGPIRLKVAPNSVTRLTGRVRELLRQGRGRSLTHTIETLNPVLRGWVGYFQLSESKAARKELDGWLRRRLRCLIWRQAKTSQRRTTLLQRRSSGGKGMALGTQWARPVVEQWCQP